MERLDRIVSFLNRTLYIDTFQDSSNNGLQVENTGKVSKICFGVDASLEFFEAAAGEKADLLVCHHGISWGDSLKRITGLNYRRVSMLLENDIALYACHLPLDAHRRYGNNAQLCRALGLKEMKPFGEYHGILIGFKGKLPRAMKYTEFKELVSSVTGSSLQTMDFGKNTVKTVGVVSGGAASEIEQAGQQGIDVYVSGEPTLTAYHLAKEYGINAIFAGHYATETFGVKALCDVAGKRFKVKAEFLDMKAPF